MRLVVYAGARRNPTPIFNEKVLCGLGRTLATTGRLEQSRIDSALAALRRFKAVSDQIGAVSLYVIATAAARDAENGPEFIAMAEEIAGTEIEVLSGKKEAKLAATGVIAGIRKVDGLAGDLGGGSLELVNIDNRRIAAGTTLRLGGLRLLDMSGGDVRKAKRIAAKTFDDVGFVEKGAGRPFYAVGGTWRSLARLHMEHVGYPLSVMHNYTISTAKARQFAKLVGNLSEKSLSTLSNVGILPMDRRETLPFGAIVLEQILKRARPSKLVISALGVREGRHFSLIDKREKKRDALLAACEDFAYMLSRSPEHAFELCNWTDRLFRKWGLDETKDERRLRHAACLLGDIAWQGHPDYRGEQSLNMIAYAAFSGIDHPGRAFLALTVFFRHSGSPDEDLIPGLRGLVDDRTFRRARILGAAIRVAYVISAAMPGVINRTKFRDDGDNLILKLPKKHQALDGEQLRKRMRQLARLLDRDGVIEA